MLAGECILQGKKLKGGKGKRKKNIKNGIRFLNRNSWVMNFKNFPEGV